MTPTSPIGSPKANKRRQGFTLLELMVVLVIITLVTGTVMVSLEPMLADARIHGASRSVIAAFNYARSFAVAHQSDTWVYFQLSPGGLDVRASTTDDQGQSTITPVTTPAGRFRQLPDGIDIVLVDKPEAPGADPTVQFTADGQAEHVRVTLEDGKGRQQCITLDPVTGRCVVEDVQGI